MSLKPGMRIGPYEVVAAIGAGGMGEVFHGRDTRLGRNVALKVLPDVVAGDPERLARFEREARMLAACNHTNIAQVYGLEQGALAMEFVEGEDLSRRLDAGPIPLDDALAIAGQIAEALGAAHEHGIVHRDLKPSNVRIRPDGMVKVLDFGLAKALAPASESLDDAAATTTSPAMTGRGTILGTPAYMSPEQAKGRSVDKRADIWAFGVVLYEMVAGRRPFEGQTAQELLAAVIKSEPDWSPIPAHLQPLLKSCLAKDPKQRLRDIGDWARPMGEVASRPAAASWRHRMGWVAGAVILAVSTPLAWIHFREAVPPAAGEVQFQIPAPEGSTFDMAFAVSPNGRRVAFTARDGEGVRHLWVRELAALEPRKLSGTEGAAIVVWKPDSEAIAFSAGDSLKAVYLAGGKVVTLCQAPANTLGVSAWSPRGVIVIGGTTAGAIRQVPESGGVPSPLTALDKARQDLAHGLPSLLPDGSHFLYLSVSAVEERSAVLLGSIDLEPAKQDPRPLRSGSNGRAEFVRTAQGDRLLFLENGRLLSQPFDTARFALSGGPTPVAEPVTNIGAYGLFSASPGVLAYRSGPVSGGGILQRLTWLDRSGKRGDVVSDAETFVSIALDPDGRRAAAAIAPTPSSDIWVLDLERGPRTRLTTDPALDRNPVWAPGGSRVAFNSPRGGSSDLYVVAADGAAREELLVASDVDKVPLDWMSDGRHLLYQANDPRTKLDLLLLPLLGDRTPIPLVQSEANEGSARFSPNGRWISYTSDVSNRNEIYVRAFDPGAPRTAGAVVPVSRGGGTNARWRGDGRELFYEGPDGMLMAVELAPGPGFKPLGTRALFRLPPSLVLATPWDAASDGRRFLAAIPTNEETRSSITVVMNWAR